MVNKGQWNLTAASLQSHQIQMDFWWYSTCYIRQKTGTSLRSRRLSDIHRSQGFHQSTIAFDGLGNAKGAEGCPYGSLVGGYHGLT